MEEQRSSSSGGVPFLAVGLASCFMLVIAGGAGAYFLAQAGIRAALEAERRAVEQAQAASEKERLERVAREKAAAEEAARPKGPTKVLKLAAAPGARPEDLAESVAILNRRFKAAKVPANARLTAPRIEVTLSADPEVLRRAGTLLSAGGHLQFKEMASAEIEKKELERLVAAKKSGTYDATKETLDVLPSEGDGGRPRVIVVPDGLEGHYVAEAKPEKGDPGWVVIYTMNPEGAQKNLEFTTRLKDRTFAVVLDGTIKMIFFSKEPVSDRAMMFRPNTGFSEEEALRLAALMQSGRLPIELTLEED